MQLSVIIINYNVKYFLEQCLYSVMKACTKEIEIFVVDNNSSDGSRAFLTAQFPTVNFIWNSSNDGFAKANNQALQLARGEYILFLNPDTILPEDCFKLCINFFNTQPQAGALGVRMIDGAGVFLKESKRAFPSPLTSLYKLVGLSKVFPTSKTFARYHLGHLSQHETREVDVLAGAFMMLPRKVLNEVGNFDETFFMYGEDVDLSYRVQKAGYRNFYFADTTIIHFKGESTKKGSLNYVRLFYKAMSQFVKKHYRGGRAGIFNALVQTAILGRAVLAAIGKLLQLIGLFLLDAGIFLMSFWLIKLFWNAFIRKEINYSPNMLVIAFPVFTIVFLIASYYSGLYDKGFKQSKLNRSTMIATLILLSGYALLPEDLRFSRGILVFGILLAFILMTLLRQLFIKWHLLHIINEDDEHRQTIVVANEADFTYVTTLMEHAGMHERILGRINSTAIPAGNTLGTIAQLPHLIKMYPVKEVIFCEDGLSFTTIIATIQQLPETVRNKFHAAGSKSIVGSDSRNVSGDFVTDNQYYKIEEPICRRNKFLLDKVLSLFFILSFPVHFITQKRPLHFFKNVLGVLFNRLSWVGYASKQNGLPAIKKGVLTSTSLPAALNDLPEETLNRTDIWYATEYTAATDLKKIIRSYKFLYY